MLFGNKNPQIFPPQPPTPENPQITGVEKWVEWKELKSSIVGGNVEKCGDEAENKKELLVVEWPMTIIFSI